MSINEKLQKMMNCNESGTFLMKEKKLELKSLNEGILSTIGSDLATVSSKLFKKMKSVTSKIGTAVKNKITKLDIEHFKKEMGIKDIQELDQTLSTISVNNPEFPALMEELFVAVTKAQKVNKELYESIAPVFNKHMERMVEYYETLYTKAPDEKQRIMYYSLLMTMMGWLDKVRNKNMRDKILNIISAAADRKSLKELIPDIDKIDLKTHQASINGLLKKFGKEEVQQFTDKDLKKMSIEELKLVIKEANRIIEKNSNATRVETGKQVDFNAGSINYELGDLLKSAEKLLK